ncbi:HAMP domain-containing sensor histidine kinase [Aquifex pyrophilus]
MRKALESLREGIALLDEEGRVKYMNAFLRKRLGSFKEGIHYYEAFKSIDLIGAIQETLSRKEGLEKEFTYRERNYSLKTFVEDKGISILVREKEESLMDSLKKEFLANLSHELKTPLSVVSLSLETLLGMEEEEQKREILRKALERLKELQNLMEIVYLITFLEKTSLNMIEDVNLREVIEDILSDYESEIKEKEISVKTEIREEHIKGNRDYIRLLLRNLIDNAIKYNKEGGEVIIGSEKVGDNVLIKVSDTGEGIEKRKLPIIFEPFVKGEESNGLGLGLTIVKRIANLHGGDIRIESEKGKGTSVEVYIPLTNSKK